MSLNIKKLLSCPRRSRLQWQDRQDVREVGGTELASDVKNNSVYNLSNCPAERRGEINIH